MAELDLPDDKLMKAMQFVIRGIVRILAVLMTIVIVLGTVDVGWILYTSTMKEPVFVLTITDILATFGAFMAVLIAIEIFVNIVLYLRDDVIHVKIVMATALMAIARKVIILDFDQQESTYIWGIAATVLAMSIGYWLVHILDDRVQIPTAEGKKKLAESMEKIEKKPAT